MGAVASRRNSAALARAPAARSRTVKSVGLPRILLFAATLGCAMGWGCHGVCFCALRFATLLARRHRMARLVQVEPDSACIACAMCGALSSRILLGIQSTHGFVHDE